MASVSMKRPVVDIHHVDLEEFNDLSYGIEVLQLQDVTEEAVDEELAKDAAALGIEILKSQNGHASICESAETGTSRHARTGSSGSQDSVSTGITSRSSNASPTNGSISRRRGSLRRSLSFADYDKYLTHAEKQQMGAHGFSLPIPPDPAPSLFSVSTRKSYTSIKNGIRSRFRIRRSNTAVEDVKSCICCRDDFKINKALHTLPCSHKYCEKCLRVVIQQASSDESKMPPKCCSKPISGATIKTVLTREEQHSFMKSIVQFSTPWEERIFCPNPACGDFIPKRHKIDPKHPFEVVCRKCRTRACSTCKREAHELGQDCPADWELEAVLKMGENQGWRRCYKCRTLVELTHGCSHITCRCKAQFCYICGAVWDPLVGCPNYCNGEEELERRRQEEEARVAAEQAEKEAEDANNAATAAEIVEATKRTEESEELNALRARQINERDRFNAYERKMKWMLWTRHGQRKLDVMDRYADMQTKMQDRHAKTSSHLEDRQVAAEMELRASLKQSERSVRIRLRHMEAYCDGLGRPKNGDNPARVVTERDLRELGQQYNVRDDLERLHQSRINVMRDKQSKQMENLMERQEDEAMKLAQKQDEELEAQEESFVQEEEHFIELFNVRRERLRRRWVLVQEVTRKQLEMKTGLKHAPLQELVWPDLEAEKHGLETVGE